MRTRASLLGHPIHVMLIPLPIGLLVGAFLFDVLGVITGNEAMWTTGGHLVVAGIIAGLIAAMPGVVDYFASVPPESSAKGRATKHALSNVSALVLFALAWWARPALGAEPGIGVLALEAAGLVFLSIGGWMGGTLVYRNFIGPEHRYPEAGKWKEDTVPDDGEAVLVASSDELREGQMKLVHVGKRRVAVARTEDGWVAFEDRCSHRGGSLADGVLSCGTVQCLWHGSRFDVKTGEPTAGPAETRLVTYPVEVVDGEVRLRL